MDDRLKDLIKELGTAINGALSESTEINDAIQNVRDAGYDVFLVLEATIGFNRKPKGDGVEGEGVEGAETVEAVEAAGVAGELDSEKSDARLRVTPQDLRFLRSLKISVEDINE